jgi:MFS family permease
MIMLGLTKQQKTVVLGSWLGWSLDGYDLVLMLLVIPLISELFFPLANPTFAILATFAAYVVTLIMRPFGGAFFGNFGDKYGRKKAMIITIMGFSIATFATGLLPTWEMVGLMAPIFLILLRFLQGFFAGGEWGSGAVITMETVPKKHRGLLSGFLQSGFNFGFVIAAIVFQFTLSMFPAEQFAEIGWRVMFFTGIIPGLVALFIRFKMSESEAWLTKPKKIKKEKSPMRQLLFSKMERKRFFFALILMTGLMFSYYASMGFFPTFLQNYMVLEKSEIASLMIVATVTSLSGTIFAGYLSQIIGRMRTITTFAAASAILAVPVLYGLFNASTFLERIIFTIILIMIATSGFGPIPAFLSERFSTGIRNSASGFAYNGGLLFGSWAPLIAVSLLSDKGDLIPFLLAATVIVGALIMLVGAKINPETRDIDLKKS